MHNTEHKPRIKHKMNNAEHTLKIKTDHKDHRMYDTHNNSTEKNQLQCGIAHLYGARTNKCVLSLFDSENNIQILINTNAKQNRVLVSDKDYVEIGLVQYITHKVTVTIIGECEIKTSQWV